jgi:hypothetical protein
MSTMKGKKEDRIAIYVGPPLKLLSTRFIESSSGIEQKSAVMIALEKWGLFSRVVGTVWDTTSSNSGQHQGAAALIESELNHAVLWLACRRHVSELQMKHMLHMKPAQAFSFYVKGTFLRFRLSKFLFYVVST